MTSAQNGAPPRRRDPAGPPVFLFTVIVLITVYVGLRYLVPWVAVWFGVTERPVPLPQFARVVYMICTMVGALVYLSSDEYRWRRFLGPMVRVFVVRSNAPSLQLAALAALPLLAGWVAWQRVRPLTEMPPALRVQHPTLPGEYAGLRNPFRSLPEAGQDAAYRDGVVLYQKNCRPCHGTKADGAGPLARGLRLRPVDFTDPGSITTVVEPYPFWRIQKGALGLPGLATPWHSAMPAWEGQLQEDEIWQIILAEYRIARREPRTPEGSKP